MTSILAFLFSPPRCFGNVAFHATRIGVQSPKSESSVDLCFDALLSPLAVFPRRTDRPPSRRGWPSVDPLREDLLDAKMSAER
uniref:Secreted protein n=1 Tax=Steinernema glaseri TaxID=37863 RepID=A0A1I8AJZ2_9BILA